MQQFLAWLWQGTMLAVGVWGVLRLLRPNAATRFVIWWAALLAVLTLLILPRLHLEPSITLLPVTLPAVPGSLLAIGIGVWLGLALLGLVHLGVSISHLQQLKLACRPFPLRRERRLTRWIQIRGEGRRTRLCLTEDVRSASVLGLGVGGAIIAIHPALLADLDDEELDHIVLHEYAHVQRRDDWLYVLQLALQALLVVHPAVSSIGRALRAEREAACDDWVVAHTGSASAYARSLTKVAAFEGVTPNDLVATMGVIGRGGNVTRRVERVLTLDRPTPTTRLSLMPAASVATLVMAATMGLWRMPPLIVTEDTASANEPASDTAAAIATALDPLTRAAAIVVLPERGEVGAAPRKMTAAGAVEGVPVRASDRRAETRELTSTSEATRPLMPTESTSTPLGSRVFASSWWPTAGPLTPEPAVVTTPAASAAPAPGLLAAPPSTHLPGAGEAALDAETSGALTEATKDPAARTPGAWQRAAGVGVSVGQGAKRVGTATGSFVSRVASSIGKVWP